MTSEDEIPEEFKEIAVELADVPREYIIKVSQAMQNQLERCIRDLRKCIVCDKCNKEYRTWYIPDDWWHKIPEEWHKKSICFECYLDLMGTKIMKEQFREGVFVIDSEPEDLCPECGNNDKVQMIYRGERSDTYKCYKCNNKFEVNTE